MAGKKPRRRPTSASRGGSGVTLDLGTIPARIGILPEKIDRAMFTVIEVHKPQAESWMRTNARWTDRSTNARNGLRAFTEHNAGRGKTRVHRLILAHSVPYGIWLEVRWSGKYAIIEPAIEDQGPRVMSSLKGMLGVLT